MKLVSQVICASCSSMTIVDGKEWAPGPFLNLLELWLDYIQNNTDSIFIVVSHDALMCVGRVTAYNSVLFAGELRWMICVDKSVYLLLFHLHIFLLLLSSHYETTIVNKLILWLRLLKRSFMLFRWYSRGICFLYLLVIGGGWLRMALVVVTCLLPRCSITPRNSILFFLFTLRLISGRSFVLRRLIGRWLLLLSLGGGSGWLLLGCSLRLISHSRTSSQSIHSTSRQIGARSGWTLICSGSPRQVIRSILHLLLSCHISEIIWICCLVIGVWIVFD